MAGAELGGDRIDEIDVETGGPVDCQFVKWRYTMNGSEMD
jgi:hypothetical protein